MKKRRVHYAIQHASDGVRSEEDEKQCPIGLTKPSVMVVHHTHLCVVREYEDVGQQCIKRQVPHHRTIWILILTLVVTIPLILPSVLEHEIL